MKCILWKQNADEGKVNFCCFRFNLFESSVFNYMYICVVGYIIHHKIQFHYSLNKYNVICFMLCLYEIGLFYNTLTFFILCINALAML